MSKGILLVNIGSPSSYEVADVKKYLKTFLMDEDIINIPFPLRWALVHGIIVPRRSPYSAANYKKIWIEGEGSPLTVYTDRFARKLQTKLEAEFVVKVGMRYSNPSIQKALEEFKELGISSLLIVPLYPQYAEATTGSSVKEVRRLLKKMNFLIDTHVLPPFYDDPAFIQPSTMIAKKDLQNKTVDHYIFSFHGLPESQVRKGEGCLVTANCCVQKTACLKNCYRAQCFATARAMASDMNLNPAQYSVAFQSRLGRAKWIQPSTEGTIQNVAREGKKNLAVLCPSFVADCIETLEEIGLGGKELFQSHGGENYYLVPCTNDDDHWVNAFADLITKTHP